MAEASGVERLGPGDHACLTFTDTEERLDLIAAFVGDGLRAGRKVVCLTDSISPGSLGTHLAERDIPVDEAMSSGHLSVYGSSETYLAGGSFAAARMIGRLTDDIDRARREGYTGLSVTSDMGWALRPVSGVEDLIAYEMQLGRLLADAGATAVCQYDRQCFDTVTLAGVATSHHLAVAAVTYHDDALLRVCRQYRPPGIRVSGEVDYQGIEPLTRAFREALALDEHLHVNLTGLEFLDGSAAGVLLQAAASLGAGQRMSVRCRAQAAKVLQVLGFPQLPGVAMVTVDDE